MARSVHVAGVHFTKYFSEGIWSCPVMDLNVRFYPHFVCPCGCNALSRWCLCVHPDCLRLGRTHIYDSATNQSRYLCVDHQPGYEGAARDQLKWWGFLHTRTVYVRGPSSADVYPLTINMPASPFEVLRAWLEAVEVREFLHLDLDPSAWRRRMFAEFLCAPQLPKAALDFPSVLAWLEGTATPDIYVSECISEVPCLGYASLTVRHLRLCLSHWLGDADIDLLSNFVWLVNQDHQPVVRQPQDMFYALEYLDPAMAAYTPDGFNPISLIIAPTLPHPGRIEECVAHVQSCYDAETDTAQLSLRDDEQPFLTIPDWSQVSVADTGAAGEVDLNRLFYTDRSRFWIHVVRRAGTALPPAPLAPAPVPVAMAVAAPAPRPVLLTRSMMAQFGWFSRDAAAQCPDDLEVPPHLTFDSIRDFRFSEDDSETRFVRWTEEEPDVLRRECGGIALLLADTDTEDRVRLFVLCGPGQGLRFVSPATFCQRCCDGNEERAALYVGEFCRRSGFKLNGDVKGTTADGCLLIQDRAFPWPVAVPRSHVDQETLDELKKVQARVVRKTIQETKERLDSLSVAATAPAAAFKAKAPRVRKRAAAPPPGADAVDMTPRAAPAGLTTTPQIQVRTAAGDWVTRPFDMEELLRYLEIVAASPGSLLAVDKEAALASHVTNWGAGREVMMLGLPEDFYTSGYKWPNSMHRQNGHTMAQKDRAHYYWDVEATGRILYPDRPEAAQRAAPASALSVDSMPRLLELAKSGELSYAERLLRGDLSKKDVRLSDRNFQLKVFVRQAGQWMDTGMKFKVPGGEQYVQEEISDLAKQHRLPELGSSAGSRLFFQWLLFHNTVEGVRAGIEAKVHCYGVEHAPSWTWAQEPEPAAAAVEPKPAAAEPEPVAAEPEPMVIDLVDEEEEEPTAPGPTATEDQEMLALCEDPQAMMTATANWELIRSVHKDRKPLQDALVINSTIFSRGGQGARRLMQRIRSAKECFALCFIPADCHFVALWIIPEGTDDQRPLVTVYDSMRSYPGEVILTAGEHLEPDSLAGQVKRFCETLWPFSSDYRGQCVAQMEWISAPQQHDAVSCGLYAVAAIVAKTCGEPFWSQDRILAQRADLAVVLRARCAVALPPALDLDLDLEEPEAPTAPAPASTGKRERAPDAEPDPETPPVVSAKRRLFQDDEEEDDDDDCPTCGYLKLDECVCCPNGCSLDPETWYGEWCLECKPIRAHAMKTNGSYYRMGLDPHKDMDSWDADLEAPSGPSGDDDEDDLNW